MLKSVATFRQYVHCNFAVRIKSYVGMQEFGIIMWMYNYRYNYGDDISVVTGQLESKTKD